MKTFRLIPYAIVAALALAAPIVHAHTDIKSGFNLFSAQQDVQIGQKSAVEVESKLPMLNEPRTNALVQRVGARLAAVAPGDHFPYRVRVVNLSDINAFALPGGYIYVNRGLVENARTEGELAGVLAHEIAHVALRHQTHNVSKAYATQTGLGLVARLLGGGGSTNSSQVINAVGGLGMNVLFLRFSRSAESEADALGARMMADAGYDPMEMASFFQLLRQKSGTDPSKVATFFSSHPSPANRESHIRTEARTYSIRRAAPVGGLQEAQQRLRRMAPARSMKDYTA